MIRRSGGQEAPYDVIEFVQYQPEQREEGDDPSAAGVDRVVC